MGSLSGADIAKLGTTDYVIEYKGKVQGDIFLREECWQYDLLLTKAFLEKYWNDKVQNDTHKILFDAEEMKPLELYYDCSDEEYAGAWTGTYYCTCDTKIPKLMGLR